MTHVVALSGGKDSTAMALRLREVEPRNYLYLCTPTGDELPDMLAHWEALERRLGAPLIRLSTRTLADLIRDFKALPNWRMRWCTRLLKIEPCLLFLKQHQPATLYVGLRDDEAEREGLYGGLCDYRYPLREWGWGERDVVRYLSANGVTIPIRTDCARCYDQRVSEWYALWRDYPAIYRDAEAQEAAAGATFRSPQRDAWPTGLRELSEAFTAGRVPRGADDDSQASFWPEMRKCRVCQL